jgi:glucosamine-6-phosphate deaminase
MISQEQLTIDTLSVNIYNTEEELAVGAAQIGQQYLEELLKKKGEAAILLATGNSQLKFLDILIKSQKIDWSRITLFHLDEYLGIKGESPASFHFYLHERVEKRIQAKAFHYLQGDALEPIAECDRYSKLLQAQPLDLCCLGVGSNGHLAFNEPQVANLNDPRLVKLVRLDGETRWIQVNQGHFSHFDQVPQYALTVTLPTILSAKKILCLAPGKAKAQIIQEILKRSICQTRPGSILRQHSDATLCLDRESASFL